MFKSAAVWPTAPADLTAVGCCSLTEPTIAATPCLAGGCELAPGAPGGCPLNRLELLALLVPGAIGATAAARRLLRRRAAQPTTEFTSERLKQALQKQLHGDKIIVVANREPYIHARGADGTLEVQHPASGLVTALEPVMKACSGVWIAHGSGSADREAVDGTDHVWCPPGERVYRLRRVWMTAQEEQGYYNGFANEGLWPLCHLAHERPTFRKEDWEQYRAINQRFADAVHAEADVADPIVLVQDYHFALVPKLIRQRLPGATIITFWHIPWPNAESYAICPFKEEILEGLLASNILGFHTQLHCNNLIDSVDRSLEARIDREHDAVVLGGWRTLIRPYPISIEWPSPWLNDCPSPRRCRAELVERLGLGQEAVIGVGVDRLDYTKGVEERFQAIERLLERNPHLQGRFTFLQLAAPSREAVPRYRRLAEEIEQLTARINARFGTPTYRPIVLERAHHEPPEVFRRYRAADVCYVSSLHDGMNLVAKEFVAARDDLRGVLVLSSFTGAARELTEALVVNPYDIDQAAEALALAIKMPPEEQLARLTAMRAEVAEFNVYRWAEHMLLATARARDSDRLRERLSDLSSAAA